MHGNGVPIVKVSEERMRTVMKRDKETSADQNGLHFTFTTPHAL